MGSRILRRHGWRHGQPVGQRQGLIEPIEAEGLAPGERRGIGYRGPVDKKPSTRRGGKRVRAAALAGTVAASNMRRGPGPGGRPRQSHLIGSAFD